MEAILSEMYTRLSLLGDIWFVFQLYLLFFKWANPWHLDSVDYVNIFFKKELFVPITENQKMNNRSLCAHRLNSIVTRIIRYLLFSQPVMSNSLWLHGLQHTRPPCPSPSPKVCPSSCLLHQCSLIFCCCIVTQSCPTLCDPMDCSSPGFLVLHHLPGLAQTHVHWVNDAI